MVEAEATETIRCTPAELLEFVMDPQRYAEVDPNIGSIEWVRRDGDVTEFRFQPKPPGLPGPAPKITSRMRLTPGERIDAGPPKIAGNRLGNLMLQLSASWACRQVDGGTEVTRSQRMSFRPPMKWVAEPVLRRRLQHDLQDELRAAKAYLESRDG